MPQRRKQDHEAAATDLFTGGPMVRVVIFCAIAFFLATVTALILRATGGLANSRALIPGTPLTVATVLLPTVYMFSPTVAHLLTRAITRQGWHGLSLKPRFDRGRRWLWLGAWLGPAVLTATGAAVYFVVVPGQFDPTLTVVRVQLDQALGPGATPIPLSPTIIVTFQIAAAVLLAPLLNTCVAIGEEFGWRGYLQPQLREITSIRWAVVTTGVIWGAWHWPLVLLGYEYGFGYWGAPWSGLLLFSLFTVSVSALLGWLTLRADSVWPAALAHGALNASAGLPLLFTRPEPSLVLGPAPVGLIAMAAWMGCGAVVLVRVQSSEAGENVR